MEKLRCVMPFQVFPTCNDEGVGHVFSLSFAAVTSVGPVGASTTAEATGSWRKKHTRAPRHGHCKPLDLLYERKQHPCFKLIPIQKQRCSKSMHASFVRGRLASGYNRSKWEK